MLNRKVVLWTGRRPIITNSAIGRDVGEAVAAYSVPVLAACVTQRVIFAESAVYEIEEQVQPLPRLKR